MYSDTSKVQRNSYIWNTAAGFINAGRAVVLLMVIIRTNGIYDAGILTIAFATANLLVTVGKYGIRNYQVTDIKEQYSFNAYFTARILTVAGMILVSIVYVLYGKIFQNYTLDKMAVIFVMCMLYALEAFEDVFWGLYQQKGRLDIGAKIFSYRWGITLFVFIIGLLYSHNLLISIIIATVVSAIFLCIFLKSSYAKIGERAVKLSFQGLRDLLSKSTPLFLSVFCSFYITNAPKYAIDAYLSEEAQACYGFIAMPVFVIGLLNGFLYQPLLVVMADEWQNGKIEKFWKRMEVQIASIVLITIICIVGAYLIGIPVLSFLYHTDLAEYKTELLVLLIGGGFLAISGFFCVLMTIMRTQRKMMYGYIIVSTVAALSAGIFVREGGIMGAAINYDIMMLLLTVIFVIILKRQSKKVKCVNKEVVVNQ